MSESLKKLVLELNRLLALSDTRLRSLRAYVARTAMVPIAYSPERFGCLLCQEQAPRMSELKHGPECLLAPVSDEPAPAPQHGGDFEGSDGGPTPEEVEAAAKALYELGEPNGDIVPWEFQKVTRIGLKFTNAARLALAAARHSRGGGNG